jgi:hypothetical protein
VRSIYTHLKKGRCAGEYFEVDCVGQEKVGLFMGLEAIIIKPRAVGDPVGRAAKRVSRF